MIPAVNVDLLSARLHNQRLVGSTLRNPADVVAWLGAVQAQDYPGAKWALAQRTTGVADADVERAYNDGAILRTHVMRPTWHFVAPADIRWLLALTAPRVMALMAHYDRKLELDRAVFSRSCKVLTRALQGGRSLTRAELAVALARAKIVAHGQRLGHLMMRAELDAVICSGPMRGKQFTYALLEARVPPAHGFSRDEALAELTKRYFVSHGPAIPQDFAWWSGLTVRDAKIGIEMVRPALARQEIAGVTHWSARSTSPGATPKGSVYLLPNYDEYGIAYRNRDALLAHARGLFEPYSNGATAFPHMLIVDGRWYGSWKRIVSSKGAEVVVRPATPLERAHARELAAAAERYAAFLNLPVTLSHAKQ